MSDTPRTDRHQGWTGGAEFSVPVSFARDLARELAAKDRQLASCYDRMCKAEEKLAAATARAESAERDALMRAAEVCEQYLKPIESGRLKAAILALIPKERT